MPELAARCRRFAPCIAVLAWVACSPGTSPSTGNAAEGGASDATIDSRPRLFPSQLPPDFRCDPTLESIRDTIFVTSCAWDTCHGHNDAAWGLRLVTDVPTVSAELVGVEASGCVGWPLVTPGDVDRSLLWNKISTVQPACGEPMPRGVEPLSPDALDCVRVWIENL